MIKFTICPWKAHGKERHRTRIIYPKREQMLEDLHFGRVPKCFVQMFDSKNEKACRKEFLLQSASHAPDELISVPIRLDVAIEVMPVKSASRPHREAMLANIIPPAKTPDRDNIEKFISDCFNGTFWADDKLIVDGKTWKYYGPSDAVHIRITPWPELLTQEQREVFVKYWRG